MLLLLSYQAYYREANIKRLLFKQTGGSKIKGNHNPSFLRFWNWAEELSVENLWRRGGVKKNPVKTQKPSKTFVWIVYFFITLGIYTPLNCIVCIAHNNCMSCPSIWATLSALLINILLGSFQLFLHSDQPLSEGEIISSSAVSCQSGGEAALSGGRGLVTHTTD